MSSRNLPRACSGENASQRNAVDIGNANANVDNLLIYGREREWVHYTVPAYSHVNEISCIKVSYHLRNLAFVFTSAAEFNVAQQRRC